MRCGRGSRVFNSGEGAIDRAPQRCGRGGGGVQEMANDDFSEPPRRADSENPIFTFGRFLGPCHLRGRGVSLGRILGVLSMSHFWGRGRSSQRAILTPPPRSWKPAHPSKGNVLRGFCAAHCTHYVCWGGSGGIFLVFMSGETRSVMCLGGVCVLHLSVCGSAPAAPATAPEDGPRAAHTQPKQRAPASVEGRTVDRPGPCQETNEGRNVTEGAGGGSYECCVCGWDYQWGHNFVRENFQGERTSLWDGHCLRTRSKLALFPPFGKFRCIVKKHRHFGGGMCVHFEICFQRDHLLRRDVDSPSDLPLGRTSVRRHAPPRVSITELKTSRAALAAPEELLCLPTLLCRCGL